MLFRSWIYVSWQQNQTQTPPPQDTPTKTETELLTAPDAEILADTLDGTQVSYVVSQDRNQAMFIAANLPDPGTDTTYQLWIFTGKTATPAGVIANSGQVWQLLDKPIADADRLVVTSEPTPNQATNPTGVELSEITLP